MRRKERQRKIEEGGVRLPGGCMTHSPAAGSCVTGAVLEVEIVERSVHLIMACQFIRTVVIHTHTHMHDQGTDVEIDRKRSNMLLFFLDIHTETDISHIEKRIANEQTKTCIHKHSLFAYDFMKDCLFTNRPRSNYFFILAC